MKSNTLYLAPIAMLALAGCTVGPDYIQPKTDPPAEYKSASSGSWKEGRPLDHATKGDWWRIYGDGDLSRLQSRATQANQELKAAVARVERARATARVARSELLPALNANPATPATGCPPIKPRTPEA